MAHLTAAGSGGDLSVLVVESMMLRTEDGIECAMLVWRFPAPLYCVSSAACGGGIGRRHWVINAQVAGGYRRIDLDAHVAELAAAAGLTGPGVGLLTAVDVRQVRRAADNGVQVAATVGVTHPRWAADLAGAEVPLTAGTAAATASADAALDPDAGPVDADAGGAGTSDTAGQGGRSGTAGTINILALLPVRLADGALVNAVATVTEAKCQALADAGIGGTGTPSDAVTVLCPAAGPAEPFGGPRSDWGGRLARAAYRAVLAAQSEPESPQGERVATTPERPEERGPFRREERAQSEPESPQGERVATTPERPEERGPFGREERAQSGPAR